MAELLLEFFSEEIPARMQARAAADLKRLVSDGLTAKSLAFADARAFGSDSLSLAFEILERARVGTCPGIDFGAAGEGWLRFCSAASEASIAEALERLGEILPELR